MKIVRASLLFLFVLAASVDVAFAQDDPAFAVMAGFNHSYFATSPSGETNAKEGVLIGAFAVLRRDKALKLQPEIQFSQRRVEVIYGGQPTTYATNYVNLSFLLRTKMFKGIYSTTGPQFSIPVRASLKVSGATADIKDNIADDFSLVVGFGRQFGRIGIEGRWDSGLKQVEEIPLGGFVKRNRAITFIGIIGL